MSYSQETVQKVWEKGKIVSGNDSSKWRKDQCGAWMSRSQHGNRDSQYGWEIEHIKPDSEGGGDELSNLRPLQWQNNASKQGGKLTCPITASGVDNISI